MLVGILFPICPAPVTAAVQQPLLAVLVVLVWLAVFKLARAWMVPATMVVAAIIDVRLPASALRDPGRLRSGDRGRIGRRRARHQPDGNSK
ncbi:hypothetical protein [Cryobacterium sp. M25]|uniref:hypothetical protein n=1 Tax=unclassified Cryobacterium TaxID=2649013 RepID=UPI003514FCC9